MTKKTYESYQKDYFKAMFGTRSPKRGCIKAALDRAHEIRQFEISLYWQRSLFFWGFILALFTGLGLILAAENQTALIKLMSIGIALLGFFTTCAWYYVEKGSKAWMANWELHIDYLEDNITGKLYKTRLWLDGKRCNFFSASKITRTVIFAFGLFWLLASVFTTLNAFAAEKQENISEEQEHFSIIEFFEACSCTSVIISILIPFVIFMVVCFLACCKKCCFSDRCKKFLTCLKKRGLGHWRTGGNEKLSDKETVWFSQRERKLEEEKAKKLTCL